MRAFANPGDFCPNEQCSDCGKLQKDQETTNITKCGKTQAGCQRYQCTTCGKTFTETKGTIFYRRRTSREAIIDTLAHVAEGDHISSLSYSGMGRPPMRKQPQAGWQYFQVIKQREMEK